MEPVKNEQNDQTDQTDQNDQAGALAENPTPAETPKSKGKAAKSKTAKEPQPPKEPKPAVEKPAMKKGQRLTERPKEGTIGAFMWDCIVVKRMTNEATLEASLAAFPQSTAKNSSPAWYRGQARKVLGDDAVPTSKEAEREQAELAKAAKAAEEAERAAAGDAEKAN
jgi:hypothetical protein